MRAKWEGGDYEILPDEKNFYLKHRRHPPKADIDVPTGLFDLGIDAEDRSEVAKMRAAADVFRSRGESFKAAKMDAAANKKEREDAKPRLSNTKARIAARTDLRTQQGLGFGSAVLILGLGGAAVLLGSKRR